jgi:hypothetical protein
MPLDIRREADMNARHRIGFAAAVAAALAGAACSKNSQPMDDGLKQDLAAARTAATSHLSISPLELGERAAPAPQQRATRAVKHATVAAAPKHLVAQTSTVERAPQRAPVAESPAPTPPRVEAPAPVEAKPTPTPVRGDAQRQHGRYKTEAEIFQQMPWIRP